MYLNSDVFSGKVSDITSTYTLKLILLPASPKASAFRCILLSRWPMPLTLGMYFLKVWEVLDTPSEAGPKLFQLLALCSGIGWHFFSNRISELSALLILF